MPGYFLWKLLAWMWSWLDKKPEDAEEVIDPKLAKKLDKQKKKEEKPRVKYINK